MALLYMNARCRQLVQVLIQQTDYMPVNQLAEALGVSRRTVYYDMDKVNIWLDQAKLEPLEIVREKGVFLPVSGRGQIDQLLEADKQQIYIFSPEERAKIIICYFAYVPENVYLEQLTECFEVSRNTILTDLKEVTRLLAIYDLQLEYQPKTGYRLVGDTVRIRALFMLYYNEFYELFQSGVIRFWKKEETQGYLEKLRILETALGIKYVDGVLESIAALIPLLYLHYRQVSFKGLKEEEIIRSKEYALVLRYFPDLAPEEQLYLTLHLLGSRVNLVPEEFFESESNTEVYDLTKTLISEFERTACVVFDDPEELERALFVHLNTSMYRYRFGIQLGNQLCDNIMQEYPDLFAITKQAVRSWEKQTGIPVPDSEIAYLSLHFGGFLKIADAESDHLRILIVCVNGISTGNMIRREVQKLLPFAEIVDVVAAVDLVNAQNFCDLIISTVKINSVVPVVTVHPVLTEFDRKAILNHRRVAPNRIVLQQKQLFQIVSKYVPKEHHQVLREDLMNYLQGNGTGSREYAAEEYDLLSLLDLSRIRICHGDYTWQSCVRESGRSLLANRSIERKYLDVIISQLQYYGPYMFLTDEILLAHAKPEDGVNCLDISLTVFETPPAFSENRKAKVVFLLAAEDQEKHLRILKDLLKLVDEEDFAQKLAGCATEEEIYTVVRQLLAET
ncbi:MAG: PRD domain-containing protein [Eubacterium sp.]|nr:PRD domain-containing protein [Eubacterium sp.]